MDWRDSSHRPHPNSLMAKCLKDPTLMERYRKWHSRVLADERAMQRWKRGGCASVGMEEV